MRLQFARESQTQLGSGVHTACREKGESMANGHQISAAHALLLMLTNQCSKYCKKHTWSSSCTGTFPYPTSLSPGSVPIHHSTSDIPLGGGRICDFFS